MSILYFMIVGMTGPTHWACWLVINGRKSESCLNRAKNKSPYLYHTYSLRLTSHIIRLYLLLGTFSSMVDGVAGTRSTARLFPSLFPRVHDMVFTMHLRIGKEDTSKQLISPTSNLATNTYNIKVLRDKNLKPDHTNEQP
jgi:hypothetical protein